MWKIWLVCLELGFLALGAPSSAETDDLPKIERTIQREPLYKSKTPKYGLLLFGPKAQTRVWVVLDGDVFYIDRNSTGDLIEPSKRVPLEGKTKEKAEDGQVIFTTPLWEEKVTDRQGNCLQAFDISFEHSADYREAVCRIVVRDGKLPRIASVLLADHPRDAAILHLDGPLSLNPADKPDLVRGKEPNELRVCIGTFGQNTEVLIQNKAVPANAHPLAEIEFPVKRTGDTPIKMRVVLDRRC